MIVDPTTVFEDDCVELIKRTTNAPTDGRACTGIAPEDVPDNFQKTRGLLRLGCF